MSSPIPNFGYKIGVGYNVALGSLVDISSITPSGDMPFASPEVLPHFDPGLENVRGDGLTSYSGFQKISWSFGFLTYPQWVYLSSTYCNNSLSGKVTIYTTLATLSFVRMNAILILPKPTSLQAENWYKKASVDFTRLVASS